MAEKLKETNKTVVFIGDGVTDLEAWPPAVSNTLIMIGQVFSILVKHLTFLSLVHSFINNE